MIKFLNPLVTRKCEYQKESAQENVREAVSLGGGGVHMDTLHTAALSKMKQNRYWYIVIGWFGKWNYNEYLLIGMQLVVLLSLQVMGMLMDTKEESFKVVKHVFFHTANLTCW